LGILTKNDDDKDAADRIFEIDDSDESENEIVTAKIQRKCPLSQCTIHLAWKSTSCGHVFDKKSIMGYVERKKVEGLDVVECPMRGCSQKIADFEEIQSNIK